MTHVIRRIAAASLVATIGVVPIAAQPSLEVRLKAAVLSKLPQFVDWPPAALSGRAQMVVCVLAPDPFGADLPELLAGERLNGRPVVARTISREDELGACQVLYVPAGALTASRRLFDATATRPVLTVSDDQQFLDAGGIVQLGMVNGRVRFDVDAGTAQRAGLRISSQLLQLARNVRSARP
jgi:hypothetical protein